MPAINPALQRDLFKLTAGFYAAGIDCPPLVELNRWALSQPLDATIAPALAPALATTTAAAAAATFQDALAAALKSSPRGTDVSDLRAILADYKLTGAQIGAALGRMAKAGTAHKVGELWFGTRAKAERVDRSLDQRRTRKPKEGTPPAEEAGTEAAAAVG
jgi:hypothetical protein